MSVLTVLHTYALACLFVFSHFIFRYVTSLCLTEYENKQLPNVTSGFLAYNSHTQVYTTGQVVEFDSVIYDFNNDFNTATNTFTCPVDGIYMVAVTFRR